jgi:tetratricopeptide (TPR) repeat protein
MIEEAQELFERGDFAGAYTLYQKMLDDEPENHEVLFMMSLCRQRQQNLPEASELLNKAVQFNPTQALYHYTLGGVQLRQGMMAAAMESYQQAARLNPNYADAHVGVGYLHMVQQQFVEAEAALRAALRADPRVPTAHAHLGVVLLAQNRVEEALQALRESAEMFPDDSYTQTHLGRAFMQSGMPAFAAQCFRNAIESNKEEPVLWLWLGQSLAANQEDTEAVNALRQCLEIGGESAEALYTLANIYLRQGEPQGAWNLLSRVVRLKPDSIEVRLMAARACRDMHRYQVAQELLQPCKDDGRARKMLARLALDQEQTALARAHLAALSLAGVSDPITQMLQAETALQQADWNKLEQHLTPLLAAEPVMPSALLLEAQRHFYLERPQVALDMLQRIDEQGRASLAEDYQDWQVRLLHANGQQEAAWQHARKDAQRQSSMVHIAQSVDQKAALDGFEKDTVWSWPVRGPEDGNPDPIFVYGWPGSAREALLTALQAAQVEVLRDSIQQQGERLEALSKPLGAAALSELSDADVRLQRKAYWREVRRALPQWEQQTVVASLWFSAAHLPTIYRLFPTARVIVLQQDELSLRMDWGLGGYDELPAMAAVWQQENQLLNQALEVLPLQWITIGHQQLQENGADTLQALTQFLPNIDAAELAQHTLRIHHRLAMPKANSPADDAALLQHFSG